MSFVFACLMKSTAPSRSGAIAIFFTQPPARSCHSSKISDLGSPMYLGFCAPLYFSLKNGPSRKIPLILAPPSVVALSPIVWQTSANNSRDAVKVVGKYEVTPHEGSPSEMVRSASTSLSITSAPLNPWICVSTRPGAI